MALKAFSSMKLTAVARNVEIHDMPLFIGVSGKYDARYTGYS
jgi:hypothetical protein